MQISEKQLVTEINQGKHRPVYLFYGDEPFKIDRYVKKLKTSLLGNTGNPFNEELFYGDDFSLERFLAAAESFSLWQDSKFILVKLTEKIPTKHWPEIQKVLSAPTENAHVIFWASSIDQRKKHFQWLTKEAKHVATVPCPTIKPLDLAYWIREMAKDVNKSISSDAIQLLQEWVGTDLGLLEQALAKAALYGGESEAITANHVEAVVVRTRIENIYGFADAVLSANRREALKNLHRLLEQGEEPLALLGLLTRYYRWLLAIVSLHGEGKQSSEIQSTLRLYPMLAQKLIPAAKRLSLSKLSEHLQEIRKTDKKLKSTLEPAHLLLEALILRLTA